MYFLTNCDMANLIFVCCLILFFSEMGRTAGQKKDSTPSGHLVGGRNANIAKYPYQTSQRKKTGHHHFCGGAIITEKFIITAAHCICNIKLPMSAYYIWVGSTTLSGKGYKYDIEHAICHSKYNSAEIIYDIGIIGVTKPFYMKFNVRPISIYMNEVPPGTMLTVSGWGVVSQPKKTTDILQKIKVPSISFQECKRIFSEQYKIILTKKQICTFLPERPVGTCRGDSGGPLTLKGKLVGLVSWGIPCAVGKPDVFTKVSAYKSWIKQTITNYCQIKSCSEKAKSVKFVRSGRIKGVRKNALPLEYSDRLRRIIVRN